MTYDIIFNASCILLAAIIVYHWLWKPLRLERFRNSVDDCRDKLFDYWDEHDLPGDNYAYEQALEICDRVHDKAHRLTSLALLLALVEKKEEGPEWEESYYRMLWIG